MANPRKSGQLSKLKTKEFPTKKSLGIDVITEENTEDETEGETSEVESHRETDETSEDQSADSETEEDSKATSETETEEISNSSSKSTEQSLKKSTSKSSSNNPTSDSQLYVSSKCTLPRMCFNPLDPTIHNIDSRATFPSKRNLGENKTIFVMDATVEICACHFKINNI